jgi:predicted dehydrogenase
MVKICSLPWTTANLLERKDIDAVIIATSDNWHSQIAIDAMRKGKAVYSEKPMVHKISQGLEEIRCKRKPKRFSRWAASG